MKHLLEISHLTVQVGTYCNTPLLHDVSFNVPQGKITALVGESGSGKTTIASSILDLLPSPLKITQGQIIFEDMDLLTLDKEKLRFIRGGSIAVVFQEPLWAFDPLMTIGQQMDEVLVAHTADNAKERRQKIFAALSKVQLSSRGRACSTPTMDIFNRYPHQLSGGQRQRAMIAQALVANPKLIIADEPTSNMDVTLQAKIMDLFRQFKKEGMTMLLISHDLGMVAHLADEVVILKKGCVVESGAVDSVMQQSQHPYTKALMEAFA